MRFLLLTLLLTSALTAHAGQGRDASLAVGDTARIFTRDGNRMLEYVVSKGETLYGITHAYGVSKEVLEHNNPSLSDGLKAGMRLVIPLPQAPQAGPTPPGAPPVAEQEDSVSRVRHRNLYPGTVQEPEQAQPVPEPTPKTLDPILEMVEGYKVLESDEKLELNQQRP